MGDSMFEREEQEIHPGVVVDRRQTLRGVPAMRVDVKPELLHWACERSGIGVEVLADKFPRLSAWASGEIRPTLKQLEEFARATYTSVGYLFLAAPPKEEIPIPDFRSIARERGERLSPNLLDTIYVCQQRQEWYRDFARTMGEPALPFVGSARVGENVKTVADKIRTELKFDLDARSAMATWEEALRRFIDQAEATGILVMRNGVVMNNTHRHLDPAEFRGFALNDDIAPLVFINGADTKSAQMFTLAHELVHIWLGQSAISDAQALDVPDQDVERWCNQVAAELLVPLAALRAEYQRDVELRPEVNRLARRFKVSTLVILRRIHDAGGLTKSQLWKEYREELDRLKKLTTSSSGGGDFYRTQIARTGKRFAEAIIASTWEGRSSFTEAFRLLGCKKMETFQEFGTQLGMSF